MVIFIHRPGMLGMSEDLSEAEILIAKNRSGQVGTIPMRYNGDLVRFEDARPLFYESKINASVQIPDPVTPAAAANDQLMTQQKVYNPFDDFTQNEFVQSDYEDSFR
jgi:hypothetical protein